MLERPGISRRPTCRLSETRGRIFRKGLQVRAEGIAPVPSLVSVELMFSKRDDTSDTFVYERGKIARPTRNVRAT